MVLVEHQRLPNDDYLVVYLDRMQPSLTPCLSATTAPPVSVPCSTQTVPQKLWATLHNSMGCACLDGLKIPLTYGPLNPPNTSGVAAGWQFADNGNVLLYNSPNHQLQTGWFVSIFSDIVEFYGQFCAVEVVDANNFKINIGPITLGIPHAPVAWQLVPNWQGSLACRCAGAGTIRAALTPCAPWSTLGRVWQLCLWGGDLLPDVARQSLLFVPGYGPFSGSIAPLTGPTTALNYQPPDPVPVSVCSGDDTTPTSVTAILTEQP